MPKCALHPPHFWDLSGGFCRVCRSLANRKEVRIERIAADMRAYNATHGSGCRTRFRQKKNTAWVA